ncbi:MAG: hypothetical protein NTZ80_00010 [Patescibacteria group bacterium]|nr:hypothetical protein [Patescibacteria group bacterium]
MNISKKIGAAVFVIAIGFTLTGCFGSDEATNTVTLSHTYTDSSNIFEINYPDNFLQVPAKDLPTGALAAFMDLSGGEFTSNVTVTSEKLPETVSSLRFALANIRKAEEILPGYKQREVQDIKIGDQDTKLLLFTLDREGAKTNLAQIYLVDRDQGYVVTATYAADTVAEKEVILLDMIKSFKLLVADKS